MKKLSMCFAVLLLAVLMPPRATQAQELVRESLASFPPETIRLEYSSPAKLRTLPNYATLRVRYVGPRLRTLEESFSQLGVGEGEIDEMVLGWQPGTGTMKLEGLVAGRFTAKAIADRAAARGVSPTPVGELPAYCLESEGVSSCLVVLRDSLGIFGAQDVLAAMLEAREGRAASLASDERFVKLTGEAQAGAPVWGVAVREAVPDWFKAWMPAQGNLQMDWGKAFQSVEALVYSVDTADQVRLDVKMDCATSQAAQSTRQVFEGLKLFQQLAWQNLNPNRPNPFETLEITSSDRRVLLKMITSYADLEGPGAPGGPGR
jgi:hypothetical protein